MIFRFLFWEAEQQQGRLRLENANRREARAIASRREIGSEKALALVGPSAPSGVGGKRRLVAWSAPYPFAANTCTRKEVTSLPVVEIERHLLFSSTTATRSRIKTCLCVE